MCLAKAENDMGYMGVLEDSPQYCIGVWVHNQLQSRMDFSGTCKLGVVKPVSHQAHLCRAWFA